MQLNHLSSLGCLPNQASGAIHVQLLFLQIFPRTGILHSFSEEDELLVDSKKNQSEQQHIILSAGINVVQLQFSILGSTIVISTLNISKLTRQRNEANLYKN